MDCLFCNIANGTISSEIVYQDDQVVAFKDIHPKAPIHILVVPKQHLDSLAQATEEHAALLGHLLLTVNKLAQDHNVSGYKTVINTGRQGGQLIDHLHVHLLSGRQFDE